MNAMSPVPADHPLMIAWTAYQQTEDFKNTLYWVTIDNRMRPERAEEVGLDPIANRVTYEMREERAKGSLWASFMAGFNAAPAALVGVDQTQVCGACGQPWTGESCGQKANGWPFPVCNPMSALPHTGQPQEGCQPEAEKYIGPPYSSGEGNAASPPPPVAESGWQEIETAPLNDIDEYHPVILGWWSLDGEWCWVSAYWTGEEWDAGETEISHCSPTHFMRPRPAVPFAPPAIVAEKGTP